MTDILVTEQKQAQRILAHPNSRAYSLVDYLTRLNETCDNEFELLLNVARSSLVFMEGDAHGQLRKLTFTYLNDVDSPQLAQAISTKAASLVAQLKSLQTDGQPLDVVAHLNDPLFCYVIEQIFGVKIADQRELVYYAKFIAELAQPLLSLKQLRELQKAYRYLMDWIATLRASEPKHGLLHQIVPQDEQFDQFDLDVTVVLLISGIHTTSEITANLLADVGARTSSTFHQQLADSDWVEQHIEDIVRLYASATYLVREAGEDIDVGDLHCPHGSRIFINMTACNRDADYYQGAAKDSCSGEYGARHVAFGGGRHRCPGSQLGKFILAASVPAIFRELGHITVDPERIETASLATIDRIAVLPVSIDWEAC